MFLDLLFKHLYVIKTASKKNDAYTTSNGSEKPQ